MKRTNKIDLPEAPPVWHREGAGPPALCTARAESALLAFPQRRAVGASGIPITRRQAIQGILALTLTACGSNPAWWVAEAKNYRAEWIRRGRPTGKVIFAGDSILAQGPRFYPEFFYDYDKVMRAIGGLSTKQLYYALEYIIAEEKPRELYILSGHHDLNSNSGYLHMSLEWRTVRAMTYFTAIIEKVRSHNPAVQIYLINLPPLIPGYPLEQGWALYFNAELKKFAESYGGRVYYEDRWDEFIDVNGYMKPELTWDHHHPNRKGCKVYFDKYK